MKFIRLISLMSAVVYTIGYGFATFKMFENSLDWDKEEPDFIKVYYTLFLAYNLILNIGTEWANLAIIIKEFSLEYFQFLRDDAGHDTKDVSLGFHDFYMLGEAIFEFFNPNWWKTRGDSWIYE